MRRIKASVGYVKRLLKKSAVLRYDIETFEAPHLNNYIIYSSFGLLSRRLGEWNYILIKANPKGRFWSRYFIIGTNEGELVDQFIEQVDLKNYP